MSFKTEKLIAAISLPLFVFSVGAMAQTIYTFNPSQDTTIFEGEADSASGSGASAFVGNTANGLARRALVQFDFSSVPEDSIVTNATFSILVDRAGGGNNLTGLHRALTSWGEGASNGGGNGGGAAAQAGDATWTYRFFDNASQLWATPGGDFVATASATQALLGPDRYTFTATPQMLSDIQGWLSSPSTNFGWFLIGNEDDPRNASRFFASEDAVLANRPTLTLEVVPIPEPSTYAMLGAGLVLVGFAMRKQQRNR